MKRNTAINQSGEVAQAWGSGDAWGTGDIFSSGPTEGEPVVEEVVQHNYSEEKLQRVRNLFPSDEFTEEMIVNYLRFVEGDSTQRIKRIEPDQAGPEYPSRKQYVQTCVTALSEAPTKEVISKVSSNLAFVANKYDSLGMIPEDRNFDTELLKEQILGGEDAKTTFHSILLDMLKVESIPGLVTGGYATALGGEFFVTTKQGEISPVDVDRIIMYLRNEEKNFSLSGIQHRYVANILARLLESSTFKNSADTKLTIQKMFNPEFLRYYTTEIKGKGLKTSKIVRKIVDFMIEYSQVSIFGGASNIKAALNELYMRGRGGDSPAVPRALLDGLSTYSGNDINHKILIGNMINSARAGIATKVLDSPYRSDVTVFNFIKDIKEYDQIKYDDVIKYTDFLHLDVKDPKSSLIVCDANLFANVPGCNDNKYGYLSNFLVNAGRRGIHILFIGSVRNYTVLNMDVDIEYGCWVDIRNGTFAVSNCDRIGVNTGFKLGSRELFDSLWRDYLSSKLSLCMFMMMSLDTSNDVKEMYGIHFSARTGIRLPLVGTRVSVTRHKAVKRKIKEEKTVTIFDRPFGEGFDDSTSYESESESEEEEEVLDNSPNPLQDKGGTDKESNCGGPEKSDGGLDGEENDGESEVSDQVVAGAFE
jgi:hypothetical protein